MDADAIHRAWFDRTGEYSPEYYAYYGADEVSERLLDALDGTVARDAAILELGCSSGRHLAHLADHGFRDLHGIDVNAAAFAVMERRYPGLAAGGTFYPDTIEDTVPAFADGRFDAVFSVETLQHIHPENDWVFADVARIVGDVLLTVEVEGDADAHPGAVNYVREDVPLYYRDWGRIFTGLGLSQIDCRRINKDTVRVFRRGTP